MTGEDPEIRIRDVPGRERAPFQTAQKLDFRASPGGRQPPKPLASQGETAPQFVPEISSGRIPWRRIMR